MLVGKALERRRLVAETSDLRRRLAEQSGYAQMLGSSPAIKRVFEMLESVAASDANVLIVGESGTGKELAANAVHSHSPRVDGPLVKINCAALPKDLIESELFGHVKGAFTGATTDKPGLIEEARTGACSTRSPRCRGSASQASARARRAHRAAAWGRQDRPRRLPPRQLDQPRSGSRRARGAPPTGSLLDQYDHRGAARSFESGPPIFPSSRSPFSTGSAPSTVATSRPSIRRAIGASSPIAGPATSESSSTRSSGRCWSRRAGDHAHRPAGGAAGDPRVRGRGCPAARVAGGDRAGVDRARTRDVRVEQAGGGASPGAAPADAVLEDAAARHSAATRLNYRRGPRRPSPESPPREPGLRRPAAARSNAVVLHRSKPALGRVGSAGPFSAIAELSVDEADGLSGW